MSDLSNGRLPVILDKLETVQRTNVPKGDPSFSWDCACSAWSTISRFDLAVDIVGDFAELVRRIEPVRRLSTSLLEDNQGYRTKYFGKRGGPVMLRVYERDFGNIIKTGKIRFEFEVRGKLARHYLSMREPFSGELVPPDAVYQSIVKKQYKRFPFAVGDVAGHYAAMPVQTGSDYLTKLRNTIRCIQSLPPLEAVHVARLQAAVDELQRK